MKVSNLKRYLDIFMYKDTVTIKRGKNIVYEDGSDGFEMIEVYVNIPCKLSQLGTNTQSKKNDREYSISEDYRLTLDPIYDLKPNDVAIVTTHLNQKFSLDIVKPFKYITHIEVNARRKSES